MNAQFLGWWRERSVREQRLLLLMFALLAVTVLWLGVYRPIQDALSRARERHQAAVIRLGEVRAGSDALRELKGAAVVTGALAPFVTQAVADAGFANATVAPRGDRRVSVEIPSARPAPFLSWVAALEARGIAVEQLSARANADQTLAAELTFVSGA